MRQQEVVFFNSKKEILGKLGVTTYYLDQDEHYEFCTEVGRLFIKKFAEKFDFPPEPETCMIMEVHPDPVGNA